MAKELIVFYEDSMEIYRGNNLLTKLDLPIKSNIRSQENKDFLFKVFKESGINIKSAHVLFAMDGLITRTIDIANINKREINNYINNNLDDYFTVSYNDYFFDYTIIKETKNNFSIFLVAIPRYKVVDIVSLLNELNINIKSFNVYPDVVSSYFKNKNGGVGLIDIQEKRTYITLINDGGVFLHSSILNEFEDDEMVQEYIDNINYFINFYSTRHFGKKLDKIYILGGLNEKLKSILETQIDVPKEYQTNSIFKGIKNILANQYQKNRISKKTNIDFIKIINKKDKFKTNIVILLFALIVVTLLWTETSLYLINKNNNKLIEKTKKLEEQYKGYKDIESRISELELKKKELEIKKEILNKLESEKLDIVYILTKVKNNLPKNIRVSEITIDTENVNVTFKAIDGKTLDAAKLVVSLNKIGIFETIDLERIELDDNVNEIKLLLKLKKE